MKMSREWPKKSRFVRESYDGRVQRTPHPNTYPPEPYNLTLTLPSGSQGLPAFGFLDRNLSYDYYSRCIHSFFVQSVSRCGAYTFLSKWPSGYPVALDDLCRSSSFRVTKRTRIYPRILNGTQSQATLTNFTLVRMRPDNPNALPVHVDHRCSVRFTSPR